MSAGAALRTLRRACGVLASCVLLVSAASTPPVTRRRAHNPATELWDVRWAQAVRVSRDGSMEIQRWGDGELALDVDGEAVSGRWTTTVQETVNWSVNGTLSNGHLHLEATENDSTDPELDIVERLVIDATVTGDHLEGSIAMRFRNQRRELPARPLSGERRTH